ncbi:MAG: hypothetical protein RXR41_01255 [Candidatus Marsarchaeota archaeon]
MEKRRLLKRLTRRLLHLYCQLVPRLVRGFYELSVSAIYSMLARKLRP